MNVGLVIQGPIASRGFDSNDNIKKVLDTYGSLFQTVVISTWENSGVNRTWNHPSVHILESKDVGTGVDINGMQIGNRNRHMLSTLFGLEYLQKVNPSTQYVIKIRSDIFVDLKPMIDHMKTVDNSVQSYLSVHQKGFIYSLAFYRNNPYMIVDFIFAGHLHDVVPFAKASEDYKNIIFMPNSNFPEGDLVLKHMYKNLRPHFQFPDQAYFPIIKKYNTNKFYYPYPFSILELWEKVMRTSLCFFPKTVSQSLKWRGKSWYEKALVMNPFAGFYEEWEQILSTRQAFVKQDLQHLFVNGSSKIDEKYFYLLERVDQIKNRKPTPLKSLFLKSYRTFKDLFKRPIFVGPEIR